MASAGTVAQEPTHIHLLQSYFRYLATIRHLQALYITSKLSASIGYNGQCLLALQDCYDPWPKAHVLVPWIDPLKSHSLNLAQGQQRT
jgi:hypothetical protein